MQSPSATRQNRLLQEETARSLWYSGAGHTEIREEPLREPGPGEVRVRALYSAISRGTERLVFAGRVPPSEYQRMRAPFMSGTFPFPVKYGYASVGRVERGPAELIGGVVFALYPHQTVFTLAAEALALVPRGVPAARAVLAANMETALNAVWDAAPGPADRIAVIGAGVVGALVGWICGRLPGTQVTLVDVDPSRAELARRLAVGFSAPEEAPQDCDLVFHASGTAAGLATALNCAGDEATVVEMSWYGSDEVRVALGGAFHSRRLKLISSQIGKIAPSHRARWTHARRLAAAFDLLAEPVLDALIAPALDFGDLAARLPDIFAPASGVLCQLVQYPAAK
jgi:threonine dehydrogenase-like Zn-dependent dehydrogenase